VQPKTYNGIFRNHAWNWRVILQFLLCLGASSTLLAQEPLGDEFEFIRIRWTDNKIRHGYGFYTNAELWAHDYPQAEQNLNVALKAATNIKTTDKQQVLTFDDEKIFRYPFIYACEVGYLSLSEAEVKNLREYLLRGGFLMVDDFRYPWEMRIWTQQIRRALPKAKWRRLQEDDPIFNCFFKLSSEIHEPTPFLKDFRPEYYGIFNEAGQMMVLMNYNNDVGDGWELPDETPDFSTLSFKLGINYLIYSYSH